MKESEGASSNICLWPQLWSHLRFCPKKEPIVGAEVRGTGSGYKGPQQRKPEYHQFPLEGRWNRGKGNFRSPIMCGFVSEELCNTHKSLNFEYSGQVNTFAFLFFLLSSFCFNAIVFKNYV